MRHIQRFLRTKGMEQITQSHIEELISRKMEENLNLEYKDIRLLERTDELAKVVSSFANSDDSRWGLDSFIGPLDKVPDIRGV